MRALPEGLAASLASGVTTLCRCWIVERADGVRLGFTDHDRDLVVEGVTCEAASALTASAVESSTGLSMDTRSVSGALRSDAIGEADIERGLYDGDIDGNIGSGSRAAIMSYQETVGMEANGQVSQKLLEMLQSGK